MCRENLRIEILGAEQIRGAICMGKLIVKTAAITLACIIALALILFGVFSLFFPSVMVAVTDKLGMEAASASYSVSQYKKSGAIEDLSVAVKRSYAVGHYGDAADYGNILINDEGFTAFCDAADAQMSPAEELIMGNTAYYYIGITVASQYFVGSDVAIDTAFGALGDSFTENNPVVFLVNAAKEREDKEFCGQVLERLNTLNPRAEDSKYFEDYKNALEEYCR